MAGLWLDHVSLFHMLNGLKLRFIESCPLIRPMMSLLSDNGCSALRTGTACGRYIKLEIIELNHNHIAFFFQLQ